MSHSLKRRDFIRVGVAGAAMSLGPFGAWQKALASPIRRQGSPYGPIGPADANGIRLPEGFSSRVIARAGQPVSGTGYLWPIFPDGAATFETGDGGWILVCNSEVPSVSLGGASAIRFDRDGGIADAYSVLSGTTQNCAGGPTPWGTWLSCEEVDDGLVWECDPTGARAAVAHPALGAFKHEAAAIDPRDGRVYLTEDIGDGGFYRFTPTRRRDLSRGKLQIARVRGERIEWLDVPDPQAARARDRVQAWRGLLVRRRRHLFRDDDRLPDLGLRARRQAAARAL